MAKKKLTVTEVWIESLRKEREEQIALGHYFDGQERENIVSFNARRKETIWDETPSDTNPQ